MCVHWVHHLHPNLVKNKYLLWTRIDSLLSFFLIPSFLVLLFASSLSPPFCFCSFLMLLSSLVLSIWIFHPHLFTTFWRRCKWFEVLLCFIFNRMWSLSVLWWVACPAVVWPLLKIGKPNRCIMNATVFFKPWNVRCISLVVCQCFESVWWIEAVIYRFLWSTLKTAVKL